MREELLQLLQKAREEGTLYPCIMSNCDAQLPLDAQFCYKCGARQKPWSPTTRPTPPKETQVSRENEPPNKSNIESSQKSFSDTEINCSTVKKDYKKEETPVGFTFYNDLYSKKSFSEYESEERQKEYSHLSKEDKERLYRKKAIFPGWGLILFPLLGVFITNGIEHSIPPLEWVDLFTFPFLWIIRMFHFDEGSWFSLFYYFPAFLITYPFGLLFAIFAINHNKKLRHELGSYDIKRDAKDVGISIALGVAAKKATKNAKDIITKPLEPTEVHF